MYTLSHHELRYDLIHGLTKYVLCYVWVQIRLVGLFWKEIV